MNEDAFYEVVRGRRREAPPPRVPEACVVSVLTPVLGFWVRKESAGRVIAYALFDLAETDTMRRPDMAFVSAARWGLNVPVPRTNAWNVVPNLAVEVISPTDTMVEVLTKVREYFQAGVELVWLVLPDEQLVYVYRAPTQIQVLALTDLLDGGTVLPGFQMPVALLFPGPTVENPASGGCEPPGDLGKPGG